MATGAISVGELEATLRFKNNLEAELQKVISAFDGLETRFEQTEAALEGTEHAFDQAGSAASSMAAETIAAANDVANSIESIGGAAELTGAGLAQVTGLVTAAIAEYQRLGVVAPQNLLDLAAATDALRGDYEAWSDAAVQVAEEHGRLFVDLAKVNELTQEFAGGEVIRQAEQYASAVQKIGGASKLTADEQKQVNQAVTAALDKFRALGQEAPPHLTAIAQATRRLDQDYEALQTTALQVAQAHGTLYVDLQRVQQITQDFGGGNAIRSAEEYAAAVERVGGVARLTEAEQQRVNEAVSQAIEKYRALGEEAPRHLVALEEQTRKTASIWEQADASVGQFGLSLKGLTKAAAAGYAAKLIKDTVDFADKLGDLSARTDLSVEFLQRLNAVAETSGNSMEQLARSALTLQVNIAKGGDAITAAVRDLQLNQLALEDMRADDLFFTVATAIGKMRNQNEAARITQDLFNRSGTELLGTFRDLADGGGKLGVVLSEDVVKQASAGKDALNNLKLQVFGLIGAFADLASKGERLDFMISLEGRAKELGKAFDEVEEKGSPVADLLARSLPPALRSASDAMADFEEQNSKTEARIRENLKATDRYNEEIAELAKRFTGAKLASEVKRLADGLKAAGGEAKLSAFEHKKLGEELEDLVLQGARLTPELQEVFEAHVDLSDIVPRVTVGLNAEAAGLRNVWPELLRVHEAGEAVRTTFTKLVSLRTPDLFKVGTRVDIQEIFEAFDARRIREAEQAEEDLNQAVAASVQLFTLVGDVSGESFGQFVRSVGVGIGVVHQLSQAMEVLESDAASSAQKMAAAFSAASSFVALIPVFQGIADAINEGTRKRHEQQALERETLRLAEQYADVLKGQNKELAFSRDLAAQINRTSAELNVARVNAGQSSIFTGRDDFDSHAFAEALHVLDILNEVGGLTSKTLRQALQTATPLFELVVQGGHRGTEALGVLNDLVGAFASNAELAEGLWDKAFLKFIAQAKKSGVEIEALNELIRGQLDTAASGLTGFLQTGASAFETLREKQKELADLQSRAADAGSGEREDLLRQINEVTEAIEHQKDILEAVGVTSQQSAEAFGASIAGVFAGLLEQGVPIQDVIAQITPAVQALEAQLTQTGLTGGAAFEEVRAMVALLSDEVTGPVLQGVLDLDSTLVALQNTGILNQDIFSGLTGQITQAFDALVAQGVDGERVLRLLKGPLQTVYELQTDFGFAIDESTAALLEQAKAAGLVGEHARDPMERLIAGVDKLNQTLETLAAHFGAIPNQARAAADGVESAFRGREIDVPVNFRIGDMPRLEAPEVPGFAQGSGGFRDFGSGTLAVLHGREAVVPEGQGLGGGTININALDAQSFQQWLSLNPSAALSLMEAIARTADSHGATMPLLFR